MDDIIQDLVNKYIDDFKEISREFHADTNDISIDQQSEIAFNRVPIPMDHPNFKAFIQDVGQGARQMIEQRNLQVAPTDFALLVLRAVREIRSQGLIDDQETSIQ